MLAHKLKVTNPQDYGLYLLTDGNGEFSNLCTAAPMSTDLCLCYLGVSAVRFLGFNSKINFDSLFFFFVFFFKKLNVDI